MLDQDIVRLPKRPGQRDEYVAELMRHIAVDAYGACLNNRRWQEDLGRPTKNATFARYPFTLALENSVADDYVTEKFYDPLLMGSVPVYLGAPNVGEFAPGDDCYIDVRDFDGPAALAALLRGLLADADAYRELHAWRAAPLRAEYRSMRARRRASLRPVGRATRTPLSRPRSRRRAGEPRRLRTVVGMSRHALRPSPHRIRRAPQGSAEPIDRAGSRSRCPRPGDAELPTRSRQVRRCSPTTPCRARASSGGRSFEASPRRSG